MPRPALSALALLTALVLAGCSDDPADNASPSAGSGSASSSADTLVQTGLQQLQAGETATARTTFQNVLELDPENAYAHYNLGLIAQEAGKDALAVEHYDAALKTAADFGSALYNKGILLETSDLEGAVDLYRQAVEADPELAAAHMRLGFALLHLGETEEAEEALSTGVELDPSMADVDAPAYD